MIRFDLSRTDDGVCVSLSVQVSAEGLRRALLGEECPLEGVRSQTDVLDSMTQALQLEALRGLHEVSWRLRASLQHSALAALAVENEDAEAPAAELVDEGA